MDGAMVSQALLAGANIAPLRSLLVARNGRLVAERYYGGAAGGELFHVRSVTKSVASAALGLALGINGPIEPDRTLAGALPEAVAAAPDPAVGATTLESILTMRSGFHWKEGQDFNRLAQAPHATAFVLSLPVDQSQGSPFNYCSASAHLVAPILHRSTGLDLHAYATQRVFLPLGISGSAWDRDADGEPFGSHGLQLRSQDMAKFGQLFLDRGSWKGRQVLPKAWVDASVQTQVFLGSTFGPLSGIGYGYLWWTGTLAGRQVCLAWGYGGQFIVLVPERRMVVVSTAVWQVGQSAADFAENRILDLVARSILPAAR